MRHHGKDGHPKLIRPDHHGPRGLPNRTCRAIPGASVEDCPYQARWGIEEHVEWLAERGLTIPPRSGDPAVLLRDARRTPVA